MNFDSLPISIFMNLKQYYLLRERAYFVDLATLSDEVIQALQDKISKKKSFNSGDKITVPFGEVESLDFKFYKGYSKAAREQKLSSSVSGDGKTLALYFPKNDNENARIEVYVNASKKDNSYYKGRDFEDFMNKSLPKYIKDILRHEIAHAYEDLMMDTLQYTNTQNRKNYSDYVNDDKELNAELMRFLPSEIQHNALVKYFLLQANNAENSEQQTIEINNAARALLSRIAREPWVQHLSKDNKKWIIKTVYTYVSELVDNSSAHATM